MARDGCPVETIAHQLAMGLDEVYQLGKQIGIKREKFLMPNRC